METNRTATAARDSQATPTPTQQLRPMSVEIRNQVSEVQVPLDGFGELPSAFERVWKDILHTLPFQFSSDDAILFRGYQACLVALETLRKDTEKLIETIAGAKGWASPPWKERDLSTAETGGAPTPEIQAAFVLDLVCRVIHQTGQFSAGLDWAVEGQKTSILQWKSNKSCRVQTWLSDTDSFLFDLIKAQPTSLPTDRRPRSKRISTFLPAMPPWFLPSIQLLTGVKVRETTQREHGPGKIEILSDRPVFQDPTTLLIFGNVVLAMPGEGESHVWEKIASPPVDHPPDSSGPVAAKSAPAPAPGFFSRLFGGE